MRTGFANDMRRAWAVQTSYRNIMKGSVSELPTQSFFYRLGQVEARSMHGQLPVVWSRAKDYSVWDAAGNQYLDFTSGIFAANLGHSDDALLGSLRAALEAGLLHCYTYGTRLRLEYLEALTEWSGFEKAYLVSSGTEATETALRLMRLHGEKVGKARRAVVCIDGSFHGRTLGAALMGGSGREEARANGIYHIAPPALHAPDSVNHFFTVSLGALWDQECDPERDVCGFLIETYQGWNARFYQPAFVQAIEKFCRDHGILLAFDEVQAGFGRTGRKFGYLHYGVRPDLICVGKGMGGGFPLAGVLGSAAILDLPAPGDMSSTHGANPLACAAGLAVIEEIERRNLVGEAERKGRLLAKELEKIVTSFPRRIAYASAQGLVAALVFQGDESSEFATRVAHECLRRGLLIVHTGRESVKLGPPLSIPDDALAEGTYVLTEAIASASNAEQG